MLNLRRTAAAASFHLWKREMTSATSTRIMASFTSSSSSAEIAAPPLTTGDEASSSSSSSAEKAAAKSSFIKRMRSLTSETLDFITREEEKKSVIFTHADLVSSAKHLDKEGKHAFALEIFEWMDKKKMSFSPSELAFFVDIIAKTKGLTAVHAYFKKGDEAYSSSSSSSSAEKVKCTGIWEKRDILEKLWFVMGETLDFIIREKEKKGVSITQSQADLVSAAEQLDKEGKHEYALEILKWMDKKKMSFSPSQLAVFVNIIAKTRGLDAAEAYFKKIDPNIGRMDTRSKNWPAYVTLLLLKRESKTKSG